MRRYGEAFIDALCGTIAIGFFLICLFVVIIGLMWVGVAYLGIPVDYVPLFPMALAIFGMIFCDSISKNKGSK